ncbi:hypothetical protein HYQ46_004544 [Verticillium longisporum]|nr:hypothetical protein HYQ46_004544 [Verticillium longisporum]
MRKQSSKQQPRAAAINQSPTRDQDLMIVFFLDAPFMRVPNTVRGGQGKALRFGFLAVNLNTSGIDPFKVIFLASFPLLYPGSVDKRWQSLVGPCNGEMEKASS